MPLRFFPSDRSHRPRHYLCHSQRYRHPGSFLLNNFLSLGNLSANRIPVALSQKTFALVNIKQQKNRIMQVIRPLIGWWFLLLFPFSFLRAADYFWVGGSGNWADISHWATTSGGFVKHNQIPTAKDRVVFDSLSFSSPNQTVQITAPAYCYDLIWLNARGTPVLEGAEDIALNIYGSLQLQRNMHFRFAGDLFFLATDKNHFVYAAGHTLQRNVYFNGADGGWALGDSMVVDSILSLEAGTFSSRGHYIQTEVLRIDPASPLSINLGSSRLVVTGTNYRPYYLSNIELPIAQIALQQLTFIGDSATIQCTAPNVLFRIHESGNLRLGTLLFSSQTGKTRFYAETATPRPPRFQRAAFSNDAQVYGLFESDTLSLAPGKNFTFQGGQTYTLSRLEAFGTCQKPIQLFSDAPGTAVVLNAVGGTIQGDYLSLRDIHGLGGATFVAKNSADLGNNKGWQITPKAQNKLYWVGDSGFWSDAANWASESGGIGGACVPTAADDVFFDAASFTLPEGVVVIDVDNLYCRSMSWEGAQGTPVFKGSSEKNIHLFGSLALIPDMAFEFTGNLYFESALQNNTIQSAGKQFANDVYFNGTGSWALSDSMSMVRNLYFVQGTLHTRSQALYLQRFESEGTRQRSLQLENSHVTLRTPDYQYLYWHTETQNYQFDAGQSTIEYQWYGDLSKTGPNALTYNRVIFRHGASVYSREFNGQPTNIDTLTMYAGGSFNRLTDVNVWEVFRGNSYTIASRDTLVVNEIIDPAGCSGMIEISSTENNQAAYLIARKDNLLDRFVVQDIYETGPGTLSVSNAVDLGNTNGWIFQQNQPRTLYWVGDSGSWLEPEHWSLQSGGPGGECVPTPIDDVFFDAASFSSDQARVYSGDGIAYCHHLVWKGTKGTPTFNGNQFHLFGSMTLEPSLRSDHFNNLLLRGRAQDNTITTAGKVFFWIIGLRTPGTYILGDTLSVKYFDFMHGEFNSNSQPVRAEFVGIYSQNNFRRIRMGGSHWTVYGMDDTYRPSWGSYGAFELLADSSLLEFTDPNPRLSNNHPVAFHRVLFSAESGQSKVENRLDVVTTFQHLEFRNSATLLSGNRADTLLFSPGKSYYLDTRKPQEVRNLWQVIGNNCLSIALSSTSPGVPAEVIMRGGQVVADFVQMRDQVATGSASFYAGVHSTNISNSNRGWIFDSPEGYVDEGILGKDVVLCRDSSILLDARTFSPGETFRWDNGSTDPQRAIQTAGIYHVKITYNDQCTLADTIQVLKGSDFFVQLPNDTLLCPDDVLALDVQQDLLGLNYEWQDGSTLPIYTVSQPGTYKIVLRLGNCSTADSIAVGYQAKPLLDLGTDRTLCPGDSLLLNVARPSGSRYIWQDGKEIASYTIRQAGRYSVEVYEGRCTARDSIDIAYAAPLQLSLGNDTTICAGSSIVLDSRISDAQFRWQDGSVGARFQTSMAGIYWVEAVRNQCSERDTIQVRLQELPVFELGPDTALCEGQSLLITPVIPVGATLSWNTGAVTPSIRVSSSATYSLSAALKGCTYSDARQVIFNRLPVLTLGPDQAPCPGEVVVLAPISPGATLEWQDGSKGKSFPVSRDGLYWAEATLNGCSRRDSVEFTYKEAPVVSLGPDTTLCQGQVLSLQLSSPNASYLWNTGSTLSALQVNQPGTFWAEANLNGCKVRDSIRVGFTLFPADLLGADKVACAGERITLNAAYPAATYRWQDGSTGPTYTATGSGTYTVELKVGHCTQRDSMRIAFLPVPVFSLGQDTTICAPNTLTLRGPAGEDSYKWSNGGLASELAVSQSGNFWLEVQRAGCTWKDTILVRFQTAPKPVLGPDTTICSVDELLLSAGVEAPTYQWQDGQRSAQIRISQPGVYHVTTSDGICTASDSISIQVKECVELKVYTPNAFSPNGDGINDIFTPAFAPGLLISAYRLQVFDRWGNLVFQGEDPAAGWDGTAGGRALPQGVYLYSFTFRYQAEDLEGQQIISGEISLLK